MPVLQVRDTLAPGAVSAPIATDGVSPIIVGVAGDKYTVKYRLGSTLEYGATVTGGSGNQAIAIAKAFDVIIENHAPTALDYEVLG